MGGMSNQSQDHQGTAWYYTKKEFDERLKQGTLKKYKKKKKKKKKKTNDTNVVVEVEEEDESENPEVIELATSLSMVYGGIGYQSQDLINLVVMAGKPYEWDTATKYMESLNSDPSIALTLIKEWALKQIEEKKKKEKEKRKKANDDDDDEDDEEEEEDESENPEVIELAT